MNKVVLEHWADKINVVDSVRGGMTEDAKTTLARVLNNTENANNDLRTIKNESVCRDVPASQYGNGAIDWFPEHAIDMVSAIYASQIIDDIVSVQSIDSPIGVIRFLQYVYGQDRGTARREGVAIDQWGAMRGAMDRSVACELVTDESFASAVADNAAFKATAHVQQLPVKVDANSHIEFTDLIASKKFRAKKNASGWTVVLLDESGYESALTGTNTFSLDPESGLMTLTIDAGNGVAVGDDFLVSYYQDLSNAPTDSMNLEVRVRTEMVKAVPHKIRANFSFDASYALSKAHGINIEESLVNACTAEIRQERDNEVINILMRQAGNKSQWDRRVRSYISQHDHDMSFIAELFACASRINFETKRGFGNWVVVGRQGLNIIKTSGDFKATSTSLPNNGAFVVGEIEGMKIIYSPYVPQDSYLVGYKGNDQDAGFVVADFLPITKTDLVMLDDFVGRQGLVSYYGTKMLNPKMYVVGKILNGEIGQGYDA